MAYVPPLDDEDQLAKMMAPGPGSAPGGATPAAVVSGPSPSAQGATPGTGTGHINLEQYLGLNAEAGQGMADRVRSSIPTQSAQGETGLPGDSADRAALYRSGDMGALLGQTYGQGRPYSPGAASLDSFLAGTGTQRDPIRPTPAPTQAPGTVDLNRPGLPGQPGGISTRPVGGPLADDSVAEIRRRRGMRLNPFGGGQ